MTLISRSVSEHQTSTEQNFVMVLNTSPNIRLIHPGIQNTEIFENVNINVQHFEWDKFSETMALNLRLLSGECTLGILEGKDL